MKIGIKIPDRSFTAELPEPVCREIFEVLIGRALNLNVLSQEAEPLDTESEAKVSDNEYWRAYVDKANGIKPVAHEDVGRYKGFLYLKCNVCGEVTGFCSAQELAFYRCKKCGKSTLFSTPLKKVYFTCECGRNYSYWTNLTDNMFDINCMNCGMPVTVHYDKKDNCYRNLPPEK